MQAIRHRVLQDAKEADAQKTSHLRRRRIVEKMAFGVLWAIGGVVVLVLFFVIGYVLVQSGRFFMGPEDLREDARVVETNVSVLKEVAAVPGALGYVSVSALDDTVKSITLNGAAPTQENVADGSYPIVQTLSMLTHGEPSSVARAWLDVVLSAEGQTEIAEAGFVPVESSLWLPNSDATLSGELVVSGAQTMAPLAERLAAIFNATYPQVTVKIVTTNSTAAIRDVARGNVDVAMSSRAIRDYELVRYDGLNVYTVARDGVAMIAHPDVAVSQLTINQARDAFTGAISSWQSLGGPDVEIVVISLESGTGAWEEFQAWVLAKDRPMSWGLSSGDFRLFGQSFWASLRFIGQFLITRPLAGMGGKGGISTTITTTIYMVLLTLAFATPIGVGAAVYLVEYAGEMSGQSGLIRGVVDVIRFAVETLAGVPSIIYGLFGFALFVTVMQLGLSMLSGALAGACLILPTIIRTTEEALLTVPRAYREGSLALGATKWQTNYQVVLPTALPGIVTGVILGVGRVISETAVFYVTLGGSINRPESVMDQGRTMVLHLYLLMMDANAPDPAMGTAMVIIVVIIFVNLAINYFSRQLSRRMLGYT